MSFDGGTGTEFDPYLVSNSIQLNYVRNYLSSFFLQTADIDLSDYPSWSPIGGEFTGGYDGGGFKITNLVMNPFDTWYWGLFSDITTAYTIKNINIENAIINLNDATWTDSVLKLGALAGGIYSGKIENITTSLTINSNCNVYFPSTIGGLSGEFYPSNTFSYIKDCTTSLIINNTGSKLPYNVGGFIGGCEGWSANFEEYNYIENCHSTATFGGIDSFGGFVNYGGWLRIEKCSSVSTITCQYGYTGGFASELDAIYVINCFSICNLIVTINPRFVAGFVPFTYYDNTYINSYCVLNYTNQTELTEEEPGAFLGAISDPPIVMTSCYYNSDTCIFPELYATPKTTSEMKTQSTFVGWDFTTCWYLNAYNDGYPNFTPPVISLGEKSKLYYYDSSFKRARSIKVFTGTGSNRYNFNVVSSMKNDDYVYGVKTVLSTSAGTDSYGITTARITTSEAGKSINSRVVNTCATMFQDLLGWTINFYCDDALASNLTTNYASLTKNGISIRMARSIAVQKIIDVSVRLPSNESIQAFYMGELFFYIDNSNYTVKFKVIDGLNGQYMLPFSDINSAYPLYRDFSATRIHDGQEVFVVKGCINDATKIASTEQSLVSDVYGNGYYYMGYNAVMMGKRYFCQDTPADKVYTYVADNIYYGKLTSSYPSYEIFSVNGITYARYDYHAYRL